MVIVNVKNFTIKGKSVQAFVANEWSKKKDTMLLLACLSVAPDDDKLTELEYQEGMVIAFGHFQDFLENQAETMALLGTPAVLTHFGDIPRGQTVESYFRSVFSEFL